LPIGHFAISSNRKTARILCNWRVFYAELVPTSAENALKEDMSPIDLNAYSDALVVLGTAGIVIPLVRRWGFSPVLGYLGAGALLGPLGLGSFMKSVPALYWVTIVDARKVEGIANLGVVFLLFLIGLELSLPRLLIMRRLVFGLGGLQVLCTTAVIAFVASALGQDATSSLVLGATLSLSSTAIVLELLSRQQRLSTSTGRASFAILLAQDLSVIPILMFIATAGEGARGSALLNVAIAIGQAGAAVASIVLFGRFLMRPLLRLVAATHSADLFIAAVLFVIVAASVIANQAGMSMALGAFVAGVLLAETEYEKAIQATIEPFKGLLLGIFFFTVGMNIDFRELIRDPLWLFVLVVGLIAGKAAILSGLGRLFGLSWPTAVETGLLLGPGGEFAFVGIVMAAALGLIQTNTESLVLAATSVTMALTPALSFVARRLRSLIIGPGRIEPELLVRPVHSGNHAIVVGYGRVGKVVCELLKRHDVPYVVTDNDAAAVTRDRRAGQDVYFGDAADLAFLKACGLACATGLVITINSHDVIDDIVTKVRSVRPEILVVARARDAKHARHLYAVGATDAVPETIEASLQLSEAALVGLGVATGPAIASIHEKRDAFRHELQTAAQSAGREQSRAIRQSSLMRSPPSP
jgi:monovalent cation:H+ antiporter-2, CPA2 family